MRCRKTTRQLRAVIRSLHNVVCAPASGIEVERTRTLAAVCWKTVRPSPFSKSTTSAPCSTSPTCSSFHFQQQDGNSAHLVYVILRSLAGVRISLVPEHLCGIPVTYCPDTAPTPSSQALVRNSECSPYSSPETVVDPPWVRHPYLSNTISSSMKTAPGEQGPKPQESLASLGRQSSQYHYLLRGSLLHACSSPFRKIVASRAHRLSLVPSLPTGKPSLPLSASSSPAASPFLTTRLPDECEESNKTQRHQTKKRRQ